MLREVFDQHPLLDARLVHRRCEELMRQDKRPSIPHHLAQLYQKTLASLGIESSLTLGDELLAALSRADEETLENVEDAAQDTEAAALCRLQIEELEKQWLRGANAGKPRMITTVSLLGALLMPQDDPRYRALQRRLQRLRRSLSQK